MRGAIIGCVLLALCCSTIVAVGQENPRRPKYMLIADKSSADSSYWPNLGLPNLWPTGLGSRLASSTRGAWNTVSMGTSRAWYATKYTLAPWSKPTPRALTGSRGMTTSSKSKSKSSESDTTGSWWPSFNWFGGEKEEKLKNVGDWQELSSPAEGFE
jgi:hypothetical protein